jgi:hypothetical protein
MSLGELQRHRQQVMDRVYAEHDRWLQNQWKQK